jgi:ATP-dependent DNA helicase RecQ
MAEKKEIYSALKTYFGFDSFKEKQEEIVTNLLSGKNAFVLMPTGGGKSLCYQVITDCFVQHCSFNLVWWQDL